MKRRSGSSRLGCSLHPQEPTVGVCASCLRDRLGGISAQRPEAKFQHSKSRVETSAAALDGDPSAQRIRRSQSFSESLRISGGARSLRTAMQDEDSEHGTRSHTLLSLFRMDDMDSAAEEQEQLSCKNRPLDVDRRMQRKQLNARNGDGLVAHSPPPPDQRKSENDAGKEQRNRAQKISGKHAEMERNGAQRNSESHAGNEQNRAQESRENHVEREQNGVQENSENHTEKERNGEREKAENRAEKEQQSRLKWNRVCTEAFHRRMRAFRSGRQTETEQQHPKQVHNNNGNNNNNNNNNSNSNNNSKSNSNNNITSSKQSAPPSPKYSMWSGYFNPVQTACKSSHSRKEESLERSRTISSLSPRNVENGLLRFYLTPLRTGKSRHRVRRTGVARGRNLWG